MSVPTHPARRVCTIGYAETTQAAVLESLKQAKIRLLVDVRAVAASRKPGFSKRQLAAALDDAGIGYIHLRALGTPAEGRLAARRGDITRLRRIYGQHIDTPVAREAFDELVALLNQNMHVALLCYCREASGCHRQQIIEVLDARDPLTVTHLLPALI